MSFVSQDGQDKFLEKKIFKGYKNGVFVDVGAHDGLSINNTIYFEKNNNWSGINIEPNPNVFNRLVKNRPNSINLNYAVSEKEAKLDFMMNTGYTEMLSGLKDNYDTKHLQRIEREVKIHGGKNNIIKVTAKRLESILDDNNISKINYLSIDVEGAEFSVIKSINFEKVFIDIIGFENNYISKSIPIIEYLQEKGYVLIHKGLDIFMINKKSNFLPK
jgi:FkbM family methyltransferase